MARESNDSEDEEAADENDEDEPVDDVRGLGRENTWKNERDYDFI